MTTLTFDGTELPAEITSTSNGAFIVADGKLQLSGDPAGGNAEAIISAFPKGNFSATFSAVGQPGGNLGFNLRRTAADDWIGVYYQFSSESFRILKKENGGATETLASATQDTLNGVSVATISVTVDENNLITASLDGQTPITATSTYNETVNDFSIRLDTSEMFVNEVTYTALSVVGGDKSVTFEIPSSIQGKSGVIYWVTPIAGGDSIANGALDTSAATVTFDLSAIDSVTNGQSLLMFATDKATAATAYAAWDDADAVVTEA